MENMNNISSNSSRIIYELSFHFVVNRRLNEKMCKI